jgi:integrase
VAVLYGELPAKDFSPKKLIAVRIKMVEKRWCRKVVNDMTQRVKRIFRWATENELAPVTVTHALQSVRGLSRGRSKARESDPVTPVADHLLEGTLPHLSPQVAALVRLQLLTGSRPGEVCRLRACDIDTSGTVGVYKRWMRHSSSTRQPVMRSSGRRIAVTSNFCVGNVAR